MMHLIQLSCVAAVQIQQQLRQGTKDATFLCVLSKRDNVAELDTTGVSDIYASECIAHKHGNTAMSGILAPTVTHMQQLARGQHAVTDPSAQDSAANSASPAATEGLHDLYEWIGAISCGMYGKCCAQSDLYQ